MSVNTPLLRYIGIICICFVTACGSNEQAQITKKWKTVNIDNTSLKKQIAQYEELLDTVTSKNEMVEFFGTVDSFKKFIKADMLEQEANRKKNMENSFMQFDKNNVVYFISTDGIDSAKWSLEDKELTLDAEDFTGVPEITRFTIEDLTNDNLKLKMINQYDTSIISLKAAK